MVGWLEAIVDSGGALVRIVRRRIEECGSWNDGDASYSEWLMVYKSLEKAVLSRVVRRHENASGSKE